MAAKFVDALIGYEYFISLPEEPSREEINRYLKSKNRQPISARTMSHYRALRENGFRSYIPINQFDVFQAIGKLQMAADRRRYSREPDNNVVQISFDQTSWIDAQLINHSIVGFGAKTPRELNAKPGSPLWIRIGGYREIPGILVWRSIEKTATRFGIRAISFVAEYSVVARSIQPSSQTATLQLSHTSELGLSYWELFRVLGKLNELLDASQSIILTVGRLSQKRVFIESPIVSSIRLSSPGSIQIKIDLGVADVIRVVIEKVQFWGEQKKRYLLQNERLQLENTNLGIEVTRNAINLNKLAREEGLSEEVIDALRAPSLKAIGVSKPSRQLFRRNSLESAIVRKRLLPAAAELVAGDNADFEVKIRAELETNDAAQKS